MAPAWHQHGLTFPAVQDSMIPPFNVEIFIHLISDHNSPVAECGWGSSSQVAEMKTTNKMQKGMRRLSQNLGQGKTKPSFESKPPNLE